MARKYSFIYRSLVTSDDNIYGHFAYSVYKLEKIQFIEQYKSSHSGKTPTDSELESFHQASLSKIPIYQTMGKEVADRMIKNLINNQIIKIQANCMGQIESSIDSALSKFPEPPEQPSKRHQFWMSVASSCLGAFFVALIPFLLAAICYVFNPVETSKYLKRVFLPDAAPVERVMESPTNE